MIFTFQRTQRSQSKLPARLVTLIRQSFLAGLGDVI